MNETERNAIQCQKQGWMMETGTDDVEEYI